MRSYQKLQGAIGLSRKAGKCIAGDYAVTKALKEGRKLLVVLDMGVSEATRQRYNSLCALKDVKLLEMPEVGSAIGKPGCKIAAVADERFEQLIIDAEAKNNFE